MNFFHHFYVFFYISCILLISGAFYSIFLLWKVLFIVCLCYFFVLARDEHFDVHF